MTYKVDPSWRFGIGSVWRYYVDSTTQSNEHPSRIPRPLQARGMSDQSGTLSSSVTQQI